MANIDVNLLMIGTSVGFSIIVSAIILTHILGGNISILEVNINLNFNENVRFVCSLKSALELTIFIFWAQLQLSSLSNAGLFQLFKLS